MRQRRLFFIALVVLALLYFTGLGFGLKFNADEPKNASATQDSWVAGIGRWLEPFGPRVDWRGLSCVSRPGEAGQSATRIFTLTEARPSCSVVIPAVRSDDGEEYRKGSLEVVGAGNAAVYVLASYDEKDFKKKDKDPNCYFEEQVPAGFKLKVKYEPEEAAEGSRWTCWLRKAKNEPVRLVVMEDGGTLTVTCEGCCEGCDPQGRRVLRLRLK